MDLAIDIIQVILNVITIVLVIKLMKDDDDKE